MRLLLFSDLHRDTDAARNLVEMSRDADAVIGAGDFATMRKGIQEIINALAAIERPTILVPGNSESYEELAAACEGWSAATVLHGSGTELDGIKFWGVGGAIPITPFGQPERSLCRTRHQRACSTSPRVARASVAWPF